MHRNSVASENVRASSAAECMAAKTISRPALGQIRAIAGAISAPIFRIHSVRTRSYAAKLLNLWRTRQDSNL